MVKSFFILPYNMPYGVGGEYEVPIALEANAKRSEAAKARLTSLLAVRKL